MREKTITLTTAFYIVPKSKAPFDKYKQWLYNLIEVAKKSPYVNLVIFTNKNTLEELELSITSEDNIKIIIKPFKDFYMKKYEKSWRKNHVDNALLNKITSWDLHMLWSEKLWFVKDTIHNEYFPSTPFYAWIDSGYFRNRDDDLNSSSNDYLQFCNPTTMAKFNSSKIHYSLIRTDPLYLKMLKNIIKDRDPKTNLSKIEIPENQVSCGSGMCLLTRELIDNYCERYDSCLQAYFNNNRTVKDDQIIVIDCIFQNLDDFVLLTESIPSFDSWFMFQRYFCY